MSLKIRDLSPGPRTLLIITITAVILFNNWLLGIFLNPNLFSKNGSVSEFGALTQPHWQVFRDLDVLSGILLAVVGVLLLRFINLGRAAGRVLVFGTIILGVANAIDGLFSLPCSETLSPSCVVPVIVSLNRLQLPSHAYSSVVIAICYLALPLAGVVYASRNRLRLMSNLSWLAVTLALWSLVSAGVQYLSRRSFSVKTSGIGQEIQMLVLAAWFIGIGLTFYLQHDSRLASNSINLKQKRYN